MTSRPAVLRPHVPCLAAPAVVGVPGVARCVVLEMKGNIGRSGPVVVRGDEYGVIPVGLDAGRTEDPFGGYDEFARRRVDRYLEEGSGGACTARRFIQMNGPEADRSAVARRLGVRAAAYRQGQHDKGSHASSVRKRKRSRNADKTSSGQLSLPFESAELRVGEVGALVILLFRGSVVVAVRNRDGDIDGIEGDDMALSTIAAGLRRAA